MVQQIKIVRSTALNKTEKKSAKVASLQFNFGFNLKSESPKKKQLKLF